MSKKKCILIVVLSLIGTLILSFVSAIVQVICGKQPVGKQSKAPSDNN